MANILPPSDVDVLRIQARRAFLELCSRTTQRLHGPVVDPFAVQGHPNPDGLGAAEPFSRGSRGQSSVLHNSMAAYVEADRTGRSRYASAEYGIPGTPEVFAVCEKIAALHDGAGAVICPSGLSAITTTINAFKPSAVLVPDCPYGPTIRYLDDREIPYVRYPAGASGNEFGAVLDAARLHFDKPQSMLVYMEAPGSGTFEIPDIDGIVAAAREAGLRTAMDNTWASHVRFKPIAHGVDIVIQATTKYEGGYGDTPSGVVIARDEKDLAKLAWEMRISGNGAVAPSTCNRLFHRMDTTEARMDVHAENAQALMAWFADKPFVQEILSPAHEGSPYHERFNTYFGKGKGNGLFSVVFRPDVNEETVNAFADALNLFWVAESWGGHLSLVLPVHAKRECSTAPTGPVLRFHAGLENASDLLCDLDQASKRVFFPELEKNLFPSAAANADAHA